MSKKHFISLANEISKIQDVAARREAAKAVARASAEHNPRFDTERFLEACQAVASF